ncbi:protein of unknown function [Candidatus Hydrogenisulfobacillus filiaventi]|uniref:Uncharacterized protein n=1 Tax=Candidatus Hydrogenisulfobacillus filiaventi TaxID=2707344 RepID=A0A6F8ZGI1_9FIRM|nr:hypothetical protein [Bacillota bacterium]CAB1128997.1 protein of unknown function [Candidatus Hydrogenisulfobacillus filiaventi]
MPSPTDVLASLSTLSPEQVGAAAARQETLGRALGDAGVLLGTSADPGPLALLADLVWPFYLPAQVGTWACFRSRSAAAVWLIGFDSDHRPTFTVEYIEDIDLARLIRKETRMAVDEAARWATLAEGWGCAVDAAQQFIADAAHFPENEGD